MSAKYRVGDFEGSGKKTASTIKGRLGLKTDAKRRNSDATVNSCKNQGRPRISRRPTEDSSDEDEEQMFERISKSRDYEIA